MSPVVAFRCRENLERELAATLTQLENIVAASVHLTDSAASVTLTFSDDGTRPEQVEAIAQQIGAAGRVPCP